MQIRSTYHSRVYRDYLAIEPKDYQRIIRFYERRQEQINQLEYDEQSELLFVFTNALFEVGAYQQYLQVVDHAIMITLEEKLSLSLSDKQDFFEKFLFRKAAAYIQTQQLNQAEHVLKELLRIHPEYEFADLLLRQTLRKQDISITYHSRPASIFLFGLSALIIAIEILIIRPFYDLHVDSIEWTRNFVFVIGLIVLIMGELITYWRAFRTTQMVTSKSSRQKNRIKKPRKKSEHI